MSRYEKTYRCNNCYRITRVLIDANKETGYIQFPRTGGNCSCGGQYEPWEKMKKVIKED